MLDFVQQLVSGIALGCVYGLIALGFVLVYRAIEVVNLAQGDLMMLGGFFAFTFIGILGLNYWIGFAGAVAAMALFGMLAGRLVVRPFLGCPQFSIIMATIGLGYFLRSVVGMIWGTDDFKIETPFSEGVLRIGSLVLAYDRLSVIAATVILGALLYLFFNRTTLGTAMRASSENMLAAYYMGIPVKRVVSIVWAISAAVATAAGVLLAPITFIHSNVGLVLGLKAFPAAVLGGFGSIPGAVVGGVLIGVIESMAGFYLPQYNVPFPVYFLAGGLLTGVVGALVGFPALRLQGIYLVIATISFAFIVEEVLARWESVTHGNEGMRVKTLSLFGQAVPQNGPTFYFLCLAVLILTIVGALNLLRSPTGRAFVAIRDSETAARSMGVNVSLYKVKSFAISAAITGFAGVLFAHKLSFISPEMFTLQLSIEFIIVILIGGTFSLHGAVLGAIFLVMIDPFLTYLKDDMPGIIADITAMFTAGKEPDAHIKNNAAAIASDNSLKGAIYGVIIVLFVLFEPLGLYGRWLKIKLFFQLFPLYKRATFKRQKIYVKSERNR